MGTCRGSSGVVFIIEVSLQTLRFLQFKQGMMKVTVRTTNINALAKSPPQLSFLKMKIGVGVLQLYADTFHFQKIKDKPFMSKYYENS